ncbi:DsbA family protein [Sphaerochaeta globosa]|uniref:DSBA oxidoreductase n=1 Tax=Sphaerochaeta globosa (strain ATCC BAA-1886 / DSM 22777 / Buddy) TaxID=158189 RepID=F0RXE5_SPHGB|nr:DsbA family protein [Sphaerochaeta globosa]ADY11995.1 DSBA oxidoreductase [Sphaerochaeta globosa str. Buddy]
MKNIIITNFTDPVCIWCWGTEPVFRALETHYPDQIEFRYVMGGLVDDIDNFADPGNGIDAGSDGANAQIVSHWLEAAQQHGMPVKPEGFHLFSKEFPSTYPQNIAYKAAQMVDPLKADALLRRIREATLTEAKVTSDPDVLIELASDVGLDSAVFMSALKSSEAQQAFQEDLRQTQKAGVDVFPSFLIRNAEGGDVLLRGYMGFADFQQAISSLTDGSMIPTEVAPSATLLYTLLDKHPRLAFEEVYRAFDFTSREQTHRWLKDLIDTRLLEKEAVGPSYFIRKGM